MRAKKLTLWAALAVVFGLSMVSESGAAVAHRFPDGTSQVKAFWNPARVAKALQRDPVFGERSALQANQPRHRPVTVFRPEVGKILGWDKAGAYSCTGSVLDTPSLRLVLTAAHCVYYNGSWARRMVFIPDFKNGRRPYGTYRIKTAWVANRWQRLAFGTYGMNYDIAILVTRKTGNGSRIGENVGAIPYRAYPRRSGTTDIYGYPGATMRARVMRTCRSHTRPDWYGGRILPGPPGLLARCNMAAGSSGGPWVTRYPNPNGSTTGIIDGLTSTGYRNRGRSILTSPYFGRLLVRLIKASEGRG